MLHNYGETLSRLTTVTSSENGSLQSGHNDGHGGEIHGFFGMTVWLERFYHFLPI